MKNIHKAVLTGLMTALIFILTFIIKIPVPYTAGYIHLGDSMIFLSVIAVGPFYGAFAAGIGSMFADIAGGYAQYAIPTLIIKSSMALVMGLAMAGKTKKSYLVSATSIFVVWSGFILAVRAIFQNAVTTYGDGISKIILPDGSTDDLAKTAAIAKNLPTYLTIALVTVVLIIAVSAWIISRRDTKGAFTLKALMGMIAGGMCMIIGYYITESFVMGYGALPAAFSIPMNLIQFAGGIILAALLSPAVNHATQLINSKK